jgi:hypothetical protein
VSAPVEKRPPPPAETDGHRRRRQRERHTLLEGGRGAAVIQQRMEFQDLMRERFAAVIERATGRRVIGFMSGNQQDPDIMCEVFILAPTDLVDDHEITASGPATG